MPLDFGNKLAGGGADGFKGCFQLLNIAAAAPPGDIAKGVVRRVQPEMMAHRIGNAFRFKWNQESLTFEAEGVVEMTLQACNTYNIEAKSIEKRVKEKGLPYIHIETDYSQADVGQLDTRIAAFLEMI